MATVDGRHGESHELEINLVDTGLVDDVHPQTHADLGIVGAEERLRAVCDIVHGHNRCCAIGGVDILIGKVLRCFLSDLRDDGVIPRCCSSREERAPELLLRQLGRAREGVQVQFEVFRVLRETLFKVVKCHYEPSLVMAR